MSFRWVFFQSRQEKLGHVHRCRYPFIGVLFDRNLCNRNHTVYQTSQGRAVIEFPELSNIERYHFNLAGANKIDKFDYHFTDLM